jgi:hypothetical protein
MSSSVNITLAVLEKRVVAYKKKVEAGNTQIATDLATTQAADFGLNGCQKAAPKGFLPMRTTPFLGPARYV